MNLLRIKNIFSVDFLEKYGIVLILIFFLAITVTGIFYNYPLSNTVADETVLMAATLKMIAEPSLRPDYPTMYHMPFGVYIYLPFFIILLGFLRLSGLFTSVEALREFGILHYGKLLPMARFISVLLGMASMYLVYRICEKLFNNRFISLVASFLLATNLIFIELSHFGRVWLPQIFVILMTFYFILDFYEKEHIKFRDYLKIAFLTGVSFGTHFIGILIYLPFLVVHYLKNKEKRFKDIFIKNKNFWFSHLVVIVMILFVYYLNPYGFINYVDQSIKAGTAVAGDVAGKSDAIDFWTSVIVYGKILFETGPALTIIFILSLIPLFLRKRNLFFILNSFILGYYIVIGPIVGSNSIKEHYIVPVIPFMAIISAFGLDLFYKSDFLGRKIKFFSLAALFLYSLYLPILWDYRAIQPSTLVLAQEWIHNNLPQEARIVNFSAVPINENRESMEDVKNYAPDFLLRSQDYLLSVSDDEYPKSNYYVLMMSNYREGVPAEVLSKSFDYLVASWWNQAHYARFMRDAGQFNLKEENLIKIFPDGAASSTFSMDLEIWRHPSYNLRKLNHIGPVVAIYALKK
ncbi:MAG: glycosyltransferase family 39 protein [Patescibacteria group bacterium]|mgnify:CR=1 FL=1